MALAGVTFRQIIEDAQEVLGEVSGPGVQTFGEDILFGDAKRAFELLFTRYPWPEYLKWHEVILDGVNGLITTNAFVSVRSFGDFISIHRSGERSKLPVLPSTINPFTLTGSRVRYFTSLHASDANFTGKRLQFWPKAATGTLNIQVRQHPIVPPATQFTLDDVVYIDLLLMVYATVFMNASWSGVGPEAAQTAQDLLDARYKDLMRSMSDQPTGYAQEDPRYMDWQVAP